MTVPDKVAPDPKRFRAVGGEEVEEFDLTSESTERGADKSADQSHMHLLDPARYPGQIRFINKNKDARVLVCADAQEDTAPLYDLQVKLNAKIAELGELGMETAWQHVQKDFPNIGYVFLLDAITDPKDPSRLKIDVPHGAEGMKYVWYVEIDNACTFGGRGFAPRKRNVAFKGLGCANLKAAAEPHVPVQS